MTQISAIGKKILNKTSLWLLLSFFLLELFSFFGYLLPYLNRVFFVLICLIMLLLSLRKVKYGLLIILAELAIGSKGYLFYFAYQGVDISIRIALWMIILAVFCLKIPKLFKNKTLTGDTVKGTALPLIMSLFIFASWGLLNGYLNSNQSSDIFFDFNSWLFLLLAPVVYYVFSFENLSRLRVLQVFSLAISWLCIKTLALEYIFSHHIGLLVKPLYRWIRESGVGEITLMDGGFVRIFFQSHIYVPIFFFLSLLVFDLLLTSRKTSLFKKGDRTAKLAWFILAFLLALIAVILISLSRSFWLASAIVFLAYAAIKIKKHGIRSLLNNLAMLIIASITAILLITLIIKFPYPTPGEIDLGETLSQRASSISGEAAASSRYQLWPKLLEKITESPIAGRGFGTKVTYRSSDPRVLSSTADGLYTTYAFEWGWLDIWIKIGIFGVVLYLFLLGFLIFKGLKGDWFKQGLALALLFMAIANFFTPYANHPLGFGLLMFAAAIIDAKK
ncbi:hypothetical protein GF382_01685 [Candidatus Falkowbacteria bacterium]|nr:hypothetical protein [Candidatus Falkowbacteria bacterium]